MGGPYRFSKTVFGSLNEELITLLRQARKNAGLTQVQAARKLGCRQTFLSKIECGERRLDVVEFALICRAYKVDPARLLTKLTAGKTFKMATAAAVPARGKIKGKG